MENGQNKSNVSILENIHKWLSNKRRRKALWISLRITFDLFLIWVFFIGLLFVLHNLNINGWGGFLKGCKFVFATAYFLIVLLSVAWLFFNVNRFFSKSIKLPLVCFALLFAIGSAFYYIEPVDRDDIIRSDNEKEIETVSLSSNQEKAPNTKWDKWLLNTKASTQLLMEAPNRAISAFFPSRGGFEKLAREKEIYYFAFHIIVLLFVAALMFSHFGRGLINFIRKKIYNDYAEENLNVFWGLEDVGLLLAKDIIDNEETADEHVAFILPYEMRFNDEQFQTARWKLDMLDATWVFTDFSNPNEFDIRGHRHFFLNMSGAVNVNNASKLYETMKSFDIKRPNDVFVYISMSSSEDDKILSAWANKVKDYFTPIIISESDIIARKFIEKHSILDCPGVEIDTHSTRVNGKCNVLLLGFGSIGSKILKETIVNGQFEGDFDLSVDIIEENLAKIEAYKSQHKEAIEKYKINFINNIQVEGPGYEEFLANNFNKYNRIIVCLGSDVVNIRVASRLAHFVTDEGVGPKEGILFVHVTNKNNHLYFDATTFGNLDEIYLFKSLDYGIIDEMAKILHWKWIQNKLIDKDSGYKDKWSEVLTNQPTVDNTPIARIRNLIGYDPAHIDTCLGKLRNITWAMSSFDQKQSNRAFVFGERNAVRLLGYEIVEDPGQSHIVSEAEFSKAINGFIGAGPETHLSVLAKNEHLRWNAYHRMLGYSKWDMNTPDINKLENKEAKQLEHFWKHACLVEFDELPFVDVAVARAKDPTDKTINVEDYKCDFYGKSNKCSFQFYDYDFVKSIWTDVDSAGMKIVDKTISEDNGQEKTVNG